MKLQKDVGIEMHTFYYLLGRIAVLRTRPTYVDAAYCYRQSSVICLSVCYDRSCYLFTVSNSGLLFSHGQSYQQLLTTVLLLSSCDLEL